jgi:hypothetical protein
MTAEIAFRDVTRLRLEMTAQLPPTQRRAKFKHLTVSSAAGRTHREFVATVAGREHEPGRSTPFIPKDSQRANAT